MTIEGDLRDHSYLDLAAPIAKAEPKQDQLEPVFIAIAEFARVLPMTKAKQPAIISADEPREKKYISVSEIRSSQPVVYLYDRLKVIGRPAAILFLAISATIGINSIGNVSDIPVTNVTPVEAPVNDVAKTETTTASKSLLEPNTPAMPILNTPLTGDFGFSLGPAQPYSEPSSQVQPANVKEARTPIKPESKPSPLLAPVTETAEQVTLEPAATQKTFLEISVAVRVEEGHVVEAYVTNRQPGVQAFESTALRIARQRRYPPNTSRTETIVLRVANQLGRKEP